MCFFHLSSIFSVFSQNIHRSISTHSPCRRLTNSSGECRGMRNKTWFHRESKRRKKSCNRRGCPVTLARRLRPTTPDQMRLRQPIFMPTTFMLPHSLDTLTTIQSLLSLLLASHMSVSHPRNRAFRLSSARTSIVALCDAIPLSHSTIRLCLLVPARFSMPIQCDRV